MVVVTLETKSGHLVTGLFFKWLDAWTGMRIELMFSKMEPNGFAHQMVEASGS